MPPEIPGYDFQTTADATELCSHVTGTACWILGGVTAFNLVPGDFPAVAKACFVAGGTCQLPEKVDSMFSCANPEFWVYKRSPGEIGVFTGPFLPGTIIIPTDNPC